jgi:hypothetical protein
LFSLLQQRVVIDCRMLLAAHQIERRERVAKRREIAQPLTTTRINQQSIDKHTRQLRDKDMYTSPSSTALGGEALPNEAGVTSSAVAPLDVGSSNENGALSAPYMLLLIKLH